MSIKEKLTKEEAIRFAKWDLIKRLDSCDSEKLDEYIDLAKRIANLPEKED